MQKTFGLTLLALIVIVSSSLFAQEAKVRHERRPAATAQPPASPKQPTYEYFSILDGTPQGLELHHDTEVRTGAPIDVYMFPIELQVLNSDGNFEPEGLIIDNFYTAKAVNPLTAPNPHNARDCKIWNSLVLNEMKGRDQNSPTWSYVEFTVALGARVIQTNEDGAVWWSDDIECWGSRDRFPPF
ncbi:MAG: hypothetical protein WAL56_19685 [Candidatus Sulfotelmatobacter sp.]